jgi:acetyl esterase
VHDLLESGLRAEPPTLGALTADCRCFAAELERLGNRPLEELTADDARAQPGFDDAVANLVARRGLQRIREPVAAIEEIALCAETSEVPALVYRPRAVGPLPVVLFLHGGGWVLDDPASYDPVVRRLANATPCLVVYVRYRLAPEHPFPAALEDTCTALRWAHERAGEIGGDPARVAFVGLSAGGNLAASACLRARDEGWPLPSFQALVYPITDRRYDRPSYASCEGAPGLSSGMMRWFWDQYVGPRDRDDPLARPLLAEDLRGLPPTQVITAEVDPLHDEGREFAARLRDAGVDVVDDEVLGVMHGFFALVELLPEGAIACASVARRLRERFVTSVAMSR